MTTPSLQLFHHRAARGLLTSLCAIAMLCQCSSSKKKKPDSFYLDDGMEVPKAIPSYSRNLLEGWPEGRKLAPNDASRVRFPDEIHAYYVGRLPSPDRREMDEAHTVYRVEQTARWDQRLPATPMTSNGVVLGIHEPSHSPVPADQVVANERARQLIISERMSQQEVQLAELQKRASKMLAEAPDVRRQIADIQVQKAALEADLAQTREAYQKAQAQIAEYERLRRLEDSATPTKKPASAGSKP